MEKVEKVVQEFIKEQFFLDYDDMLSKEIRRIGSETIKFFESRYNQRKEQLSELNKARNEIKRSIERAKQGFTKNNIKSKEERIKFAREILTQVLELSALTARENLVRENSANSAPVTDLSIITNIFSKGEFGKPLKEMLYSNGKIYGISIVNKIKIFYTKTQKIFKGIAIISLKPDLFPLEVLNREILMEIVDSRKYRTVTEIMKIEKFDIDRIQGKIVKKHQRDIPSFSF